MDPVRLARPEGLEPLRYPSRAWWPPERRRGIRAERPRIGLPRGLRAFSDQLVGAARGFLSPIREHPRVGFNPFGENRTVTAHESNPDFRCGRSTELDDFVSAFLRHHRDRVNQTIYRDTADQVVERPNLKPLVAFGAAL